MSQNQNVNHSIQVANTIGQVGCVIGFIAIIIIGIAFGVGTLIDRWMENERQWATIILMLGSFPITLYAMIQVSLRTMARANAKAEQLKKQSEIAQEDNSEA